MAVKKKTTTKSKIEASSKNAKKILPVKKAVAKSVPAKKTSNTAKKAPVKKGSSQPVAKKVAVKKVTAVTKKVAKKVAKPTTKVVAKKILTKKTVAKKAAVKKAVKASPKKVIKKSPSRKTMVDKTLDSLIHLVENVTKAANRKVSEGRAVIEKIKKSVDATPKKAGRKKSANSALRKQGKLTKAEAKALLAQTRGEKKPTFNYKITSTPKLPIKSILVSQVAPAPGQKTPYDDIINKYKVKIDYRAFTQIDGIDVREFRRMRINLAEHTAVIFTSKNAIEHYFRIAEEMRHKISDEAKYFCKTEAVALYLQKFIQYRKRKVFHGNGSQHEFEEQLMRFRETDTFLFPCSEIHQDSVTKFLEDHKFKFTKAVIFKTVSSNLHDLENVFYDLLVFFTPVGLKSLFDNFPKFKQNNTRIAAFGHETCQAVVDANLKLNIAAPTPENPSLATAIEKYIKANNF